MQRARPWARLGLLLNLIALSAIGLAIAAAIRPEFLLSLASQPLALWVVAALAGVWTLGYLVLAADTLRRLELRQLGFTRAGRRDKPKFQPNSRTCRERTALRLAAVAQ